MAEKAKSIRLQYYEKTKNPTKTAQLKNPKNPKKIVIEHLRSHLTPLSHPSYPLSIPQQSLQKPFKASPTPSKMPSTAHIFRPIPCILQKIPLSLHPNKATKQPARLSNSSGEMVEWSITAVLKTAALRGAGGSNPSLSAKSVTTR